MDAEQHTSRKMVSGFCRKSEALPTEVFRMQDDSAGAGAFSGDSGLALAEVDEADEVEASI